MSRTNNGINTGTGFHNIIAEDWVTSNTGLITLVEKGVYLFYVDIISGGTSVSATAVAVFEDKESVALLNAHPTPNANLLHFYRVHIAANGEAKVQEMTANENDSSVYSFWGDQSSISVPNMRAKRIG